MKSRGDDNGPNVEMELECQIEMIVDYDCMIEWPSSTCSHVVSIVRYPAEVRDQSDR